MRLFHEKGYHNVGLAEICEKTQMKKGSFYNAFTSKESFYIQSLVLFTDKQCAYIEKILEANGKRAIDQLLGFFTEMLQIAPKIEFSGCLINGTMSEVGALHPKIASSANEQYRRLLKK